jgi:HK97 gp10 family phage protein
MEVAKIILDTKRLDELAAKLGTNTDGALKAIAFQVEGIAKTLAPVDTGALRNSLETEKIQEGLYQVHDGVEYGIYQELGTYKMAAHPFLIPAVEQVGKQVNGIVAKEVFK